MRLLAFVVIVLLSASGYANDLIDHGRFERYTDAQKTADQLRAEGRQITVFREPIERNGYAVQLLYYQLYSAAEWASIRLQRQGYQAWVIPQSEALGYVIQVAIVPTQAEVNQLRAALDDMGHRNIRVRPMRWRSYQYFVQETVSPYLDAPETHLTDGTAIAKTDSITSTNTSVTEEPESFSFGADDGVMTFGAQTNYDALLVQQDKNPSLRNQGFEIEDLRLELGFLNADEAAIVDSSHYGMINMGYKFQTESGWDGRVGVRADSVRQGPEKALREAYVDYGETFVRYRHGEHKFLIGAQNINWGSLDELAPGNLIATQDLTRYTLDDLSRRYRPTPLIRYEGWFDRLKLDVIAIPVFRAAELPDIDSIWSPVDVARGRVVGLPNDPLFGALIQSSRFDTDIERDHGGGGIRLSHQGRGLDIGGSLQHVRHSTPYFEMNTEVRAALLTGTPPAIAPSVSNAATFTALHPFTDVFSLDISTVWGDTTWRAELAYLSDVPVTTMDFRVITAPSAQLGMAMEMFPGDGNSRLSLQLGYTSISADEVIWDKEAFGYFSGELELLFARESWRFRTRFYSSYAENQIDYYINPELAYIRSEPSEWYLGVHWFDGDEGTAGEYHREHSLFVLGWRTRY